MKRGKQEKNKKKGNLLSTIICMIIGGIMGFMSIFFIDEYGLKFSSYIIFFVAFFISFVLHIIIHELGHLQAGLMSGYKFSSFRIGSLTWISVDGKIKLKRYKIKGTGGQCLMIPPENSENNYPVIFYNLGGVLMNLITSAVMLVPAILLESAELVIFALVGVSSAVTNGIPMRMSGIANDGKNAIELSKDAEARKFFYIQLKSNALLMEGIRLKDMPNEWFEVPEGSNLNNLHICTTLYLQASRLIDKGEYEKAEELIAWTLKNAIGMIEMYKMELRCELMFLKIIAGKRDEAEQLYTKELKRYIYATASFMSRHRLMYAYYTLMEKDTDKAKKELHKFNKIKKTHPYKGDIAMEEELLGIVG